MSVKKPSSLDRFSIYELKNDSLKKLVGGVDGPKKTETAAHWTRETVRDRDNDVETKPSISEQGKMFF